MKKILNETFLKNAIKRAQERQIVLPTFKQLENPDLIPDKVKQKLKEIGLWDLHSLNLFRITWKNEPKERGGLFGQVNFIELPKALTGVKARIIVLTGKWFPTGAHKVGAAYGCLVPRIVTGHFDPTYHKAVWPSTGNYCRGGAFDSYLLGVSSVAILPEEMSKERFDWLRNIGAEIIATPGCESNVKEIYDACWEIRRNRKDCIIFNQFDEFGNSCWHYAVTGKAMEEVVIYSNSKINAFVSATGSAGTIAAGDYLKTIFPSMKIVASEALQCPTMFMNGFGAHRIEGIGDKHIPWIHHVKNTDIVTAIDDMHCLRLFRLFNERQGLTFLKSIGLNDENIFVLPLIGISGIANLISAIKTAKYFELDENNTIITIATDSADMYRSRLEELKLCWGEYTELQAAKDFERCLQGITTDFYKELSYYDKKRIHNLKYFTWVEQQGKTADDLNRLWYDEGFWTSTYASVEIWDELIEEFNERSGVLKKL